jgi:hypothetical protein
MAGPSMMDMTNKQDLSAQLQLQFQGNQNFGTASFVDPSVIPPQATRYAGPSSMMGGQRMHAFTADNLPFTPLTPNTIEEIVQNSENTNRNLPVKQEQANMGLSIQQLSQLGFDQLEQQQFQQYQMQMQQQYNDNKRKQLPSFDELGQEQQDEDSPQTKKRKFNNLTIQVPPNRPQIAMRRVDGNLDQFEEQQETSQFQVPKSKQQSPPPQLMVIPPSMNSSGSSTDTTQNLTPLGASATFSPYTTDKSPTTNSPVNLSTPTTLNNMDWVKSKQQEEITTNTTT